MVDLKRIFEPQKCDWWKFEPIILLRTNMLLRTSDFAQFLPQAWFCWVGVERDDDLLSWSLNIIFHNSNSPPQLLPMLKWQVGGLVSQVSEVTGWFFTSTAYRWAYALLVALFNLQKSKVWLTDNNNSCGWMDNKLTLITQNQTVLQQVKCYQ